jgi:hypothetical protein
MNMNFDDGMWFLIGVFIMCLFLLFNGSLVE